MEHFIPQRPQIDHLALLYHLGQVFNSSLDLDEVLNTVMDEVIKAMRAERGFMMLWDESVDPRTGPESKLKFRVARGLDQHTIDHPQFQVSRGVVIKVARDGVPVHSSDAQTDDRFSGRQSVMILGLRSILCVPLRVKEKILGVIYVDNRLQAGIFTQADLDLLTSIASSAAIAIENARLYQLAVEKGRMEQELQMARRVQTSLLPAEIPALPGWDFAARWLPARQVGGDYYDFIYNEVDYQSTPLLGLVIADATDKGMPAALFMAFTRSIVRASVLHSLTPAAGITQANRLICADSHKGLFVTLAYALLNPVNGELVYVNAGHNPALIFHRHETPGSPAIGVLSATGMPLGVESDQVYTQRTEMIHNGDFVVFYTDGLTEASAPDGRMFGLEGLEAVLQQVQHLPASGIADALVQAVGRFTGTGVPDDDLTLVILKRSE